MKKGRLKALELLIKLKRPNTARRYHQVLKDFAFSLGAKYPSEQSIRALFEATSTEALSYMADLKNRQAPDGSPLADATVSNSFAILKALYAQLRKARIVERNPFEEIQGMLSLRQKHQKRPTALIPFDKVFAIIDGPGRQTKRARQLVALLAVLFGTGCRRSEVAALNLSDIMATPDGVPYLKIRESKGGQGRAQALPAWAMERLTPWVSERIRDGAGDTEPLFVMLFAAGNHRGRLQDKQIYRWYRAACARQGVRNVGPHSARATYASMLKTLQWDDREVARSLGHSTTKMVEIYDKREKSARTHPGRFLTYEPGEDIEH